MRHSGRRRWWTTAACGACLLASACSDAVYAQFFFLGLPGVILAGLLTVTVAGVSAARRRSETALLRTRGATVRVLVRLAVAEAALVGLVGAVAGIGLALILCAAVFHDAALGPNTASTVVWAGASAVLAAVIATTAVVVPALHDARSSTVAAARRSAGEQRRPLWQRLGIDVWLVAAGLLAFWLSSRNGYQLVLAPEGVASISVSVRNSDAQQKPGRAGGGPKVSGWVEIVVRDHGPGLPDAFIPHAFERFRRADPGRSSADGGSELGLAIVQAVAKEHGGAAAIAKRRQRGSRRDLATAGLDPTMNISARLAG